MSSYLNIYLEKRKKEGEENGERLLLCSISRANNLYSLFRDNNIGVCTEGNMHKFTVSDINAVIDELNMNISRVLADIAHLKEVLPLVSEKESVSDMYDNIITSKNYYQELMSDRAMLMALGSLFADINEDWSDFTGLYWKID